MIRAEAGGFPEPHVLRAASTHRAGGVPAAALLGPNVWRAAQDATTP
jgi:hypothetical protein